MDHSNQRSVVVTGLGVVSPVGIGRDAFWEALEKGRSGIRKITRFDASEYPCQVAGEVEGFDPLLYMPEKEAKRMDRSTQFAVAAAKMAVEDARLSLDEEDPQQIAVSMGTTMGGVGFSYEQHALLIENGVLSIHPLTASITFPNACSSCVSGALGVEGPSRTISTACTSSFDALAYGADLIRAGAATVAVAGGTEAPLFQMFFSAVTLSRIMSAQNGGSPNVPRPFDGQRDGTVLGEGSAVLILEEAEHAVRRSAPIYGELVGFGSTCNAGHMVRPDYKGISRAIQIALEQAGLGPEQIDYIHATGSGTRAGDVTETIAVKDALGRHAYMIPISSVKSMIGHVMGAAGALETSACILAVARDTIPPTINYEHPDPDCDLDYVPNSSRMARVRNALANCFGFGGKNACLIVSKRLH